MGYRVISHPALSLSPCLITRTLFYPLKFVAIIQFAVLWKCNGNENEKRKHDNIHVLPNGLLNFVVYQRRSRTKKVEERTKMTKRKQQQTKPNSRIVNVKWATTQHIANEVRMREIERKNPGIFSVSLLLNHLIIKIGVAARMRFCVCLFAFFVVYSICFVYSNQQQSQWQKNEIWIHVCVCFFGPVIRLQQTKTSHRVHQKHLEQQQEQQK